MVKKKGVGEQALVVPIELSTAGVIGFAIRSEYDAFRFYSAMSERVSDAALSRMLQDLAAAELKHMERLQAFFSQLSPGSHADAVGRIRAGTMGYLSIDKRLGPLAKMGEIEVVTVAMWEELRARDFYAGALRDADEKPLQEILEWLVGMEDEHFKMLQRFRERSIEWAT